MQRASVQWRGRVEREAVCGRGITGEEMARVRLALDLRQDDLAPALGLSVPTVKRMEARAELEPWVRDALVGLVLRLAWTGWPRLDSPGMYVRERGLAAAAALLEVPRSVLSAASAASISASAAGDRAAHGSF